MRNKITLRTFRKMEKLCDLSFDIIWSFDNSVFYDLDALPKSVFKISHIVDLNMDFQLAQAAQSADICFCTTDILKTKLLRYNEKTYKINHGLAIGHKEKPSKQRNESQLKAVYVGNLAMKYMDWHILLSTAQQHPNIDFMFFGPHAQNYDTKINAMHDDKRRLFELDNTFAPGTIDSDEIPSILAQADFLLIAYQEAHHQDQANPHKVMEYLASGKPIVSTFTKEYDGLGLFEMSIKNKEFEHLFKQAVFRLKDLNANELAQQRKKFASNNTYDLQISRIEKIIADKTSVKQ